MLKFFRCSLTLLLIDPFKLYLLICSFFPIQYCKLVFNLSLSSLVEMTLDLIIDFSQIYQVMEIAIEILILQ